MISIPTIFMVDLLSAFWIAIMTWILFLWLPLQRIKSTKYTLNKVELLGFWLRTILTISLGVFALSYSNLLNWLTLVIIYLGCLLINRKPSAAWRIETIQKAMHQRTINLVDFLDRGLSLGDFIVRIEKYIATVRTQVANYTVHLITYKGIVFFVLLIAILLFSCLLRLEYPLSGLRFSHPDRYQTLLITRQILARDYPHVDHLPILPIWAATLSLLGSVDPMQAIRFLGPAIGIGVAIAIGYLVKTMTGNIYGGLVGMLFLGGYFFTGTPTRLETVPWIDRLIVSLNDSLIRQWTGNEIELGALFLLLGLTYYFGSDRQTRLTNAFKLNVLATIALVAMCHFPLLILVTVAAIGFIGDKQTTLIAITIIWISLAVCGAIAPESLPWLQGFLVTLPLALSLWAGLLFVAIANLIQLIVPRWGEIVALGSIFALSLNFLLPLTPQIIYLEYDLAARKSLEINNLFPPKTWTLVAPVEQLAEIYGIGWYSDLALFVEKYGNKAKREGFNFPISGNDLFVMVEKIPFVTFPNEPDTLPYQILSDPTYLHYRSTAGRSSLEYEAFQMCEAYSKNHPNSEIYYEDRELKIYHFLAS